jgi:putative holliday junction resolvase
MPRILAIDYGKKRTGLAVTDNLQMIANALDTVASNELFDFLKKYLAKESVEAFVIGLPKTLSNQDSENAARVRKIIEQLKITFPDLLIYGIDERFTSSMALQTMAMGGLKKKDRQDKSMVDKISATIILQSFLEQKSFGKTNPL